MALPLPDKIVLTLYHVEDMSYEEIAIVTGLPVGRGKGHLFGARRRLKDQLLARYGRGVVTRHLTDRQLQEWVAGGTPPRRVPSVCSSGQGVRRVVAGFGAPPGSDVKPGVCLHSGGFGHASATSAVDLRGFWAPCPMWLHRWGHGHCVALWH